MGFLLLGLGDFQSDGTASEREALMVPQGVTISPCAVRNGALQYGSPTISIWDQLVEEEGIGVLQSGDELRSHLMLHGCPELDSQELLDAIAADFYGYELIRPGRDGYPDPIALCTGCPETCPTTPEEVGAGKQHLCNGLLGGFGGRVAVQGEQIVWVACLALTTEAEGSSSEASGAWSSASAEGWSSRSEETEGEPEPAPAPARRDAEAELAVLRESVRSTASLQRKATEHNRRILRSHHPGRTLYYVVGGGMFLIDSHPDFRNQNADYVEWVNADRSRITGRLRVGDLTWLIVIDEEVPGDVQGMVREAIKDFAPNYRVRFGPASHPEPGDTTTGEGRGAAPEAPAKPTAESVLEQIRDNFDHGHITSKVALKKARAVSNLLYMGRIQPGGDSAEVKSALRAFLCQVEEEEERADRALGQPRVEHPDKVHASLAGWAARCDEELGGTTEDIVDALIDKRVRRTMPEGYRGACYTSAYVLKENLCGRPTDFAFTRETEVVHMGSKDRTKRLGRPVLINATADELKRFVTRADPGTVFEIGAYDEESGHAIIAIAPNVFLDIENSAPAQHVLALAAKMGKDRFVVWEAGQVADGITVDSRTTT
ncbi:hypothetical protein [Streptomyces sp. WAC06614]|uniref:hypothetical protein n=1 Tax=Streptomyces sp. WAC06614 TaxID=2487416 RepID=UPI000F7BA433|nr:hypothetical protein [Streptomyces sp. WAC06614]RSS76716.1 hypothetical protein EF918_23230 [Streptomyces sp. WAC06614]